MMCSIWISLKMILQTSWRQRIIIFSINYYEWQVSQDSVLQVEHHFFSVSPVEKSDINKLSNSVFSGTSHSKIISRKSIELSSIHSAGKFFIFNCSLYSGVSYSSIWVCASSQISSNTSLARVKSSVESGWSQTIRISMMNIIFQSQLEYQSPQHLQLIQLFSLSRLPLLLSHLVHILQIQKK